jgi:hypothetical protein
MVEENFVAELESFAVGSGAHNLRSVGVAASAGGGYSVVQKLALQQAATNFAPVRQPQRGTYNKNHQIYANISFSVHEIVVCIISKSLLQLLSKGEFLMFSL